MRSIIYKYTLAVTPVLLFVLLLQSCAKDPMKKVGTTYDGPDVVEFAHTSGSLARTVTTAATAKFDSVRIQLVAPQRGVATNVVFEVDPSSTAVPTTDYIFVTPAAGNTAVIDANTSFVQIKIQFNKVTTAKTLKLNLKSGDNVGISQNYKSIVFSLK